MSQRQFFMALIVGYERQLQKTFYLIQVSTTLELSISDFNLKNEVFESRNRTVKMLNEKQNRKKLTVLCYIFANIFRCFRMLNLCIYVYSYLKRVSTFFS